MMRIARNTYICRLNKRVTNCFTMNIQIMLVVETKGFCTMHNVISRKHTKSSVLLQYLLAHLIWCYWHSGRIKCVYYTTYWCSVHTHAVVLAHQIWCASTVPASQHTQSGVYNTPQVLCPEWQIVECSAHPLWCVLYTRCRSVNTIHQSVLQTLQ